MGFWQGLNAGFAAVQEQKIRKRERQEDIELRKAEREEQRKYEREMFMLQTAESRRDALLTQFVKKEQEKAEASVLTGKAKSFLTRLGDSSDPRVAAIASDVRTAADLEDQIAAIEIDAAKSGVELPPLQGEALLDLLTVYDPGTRTVAPIQVTFDDLLTGDFSDPENYYKTAAALSQPAPRVDVRLSPEAYRRFNPDVLEPGKEAFDQEVLRLATGALNAAGDDAKEDSKLRALIDNYGEEGSGDRFALMDMFGQQALTNLVAMDNPYIQDIKNDPVLSRYFKMAQLNKVINDPEATEEERAMAQELLQRLR